MTSTRTLLSGADLVLPDRVASGLTLVIEDGRIADIAAMHPVRGSDHVVDLTGHLVVPGFVDVHVHGALGVDVLESAQAVAAVAKSLPRWGVTSFCPTSVACDPATLQTFLGAVGSARMQPAAGSARVLPAHLESNFISPEFRGAQPLECLRRFHATSEPEPGTLEPWNPGTFSSTSIIAALDAHLPDVAIVTIASEIEGGLDLLRHLRARKIRVSLGHSGATYDEAQQAIALGACHATHLFNRMRPVTHREPGLAGAVLASEDIAAEVICDGRHVHPAVIRTTIAAKGPSRVMAITDATAGAGLAEGARATLGGRPIIVGDVARLEDGTMAGSVVTMDRAFATLVTQCGLDLVHAATVTSTTPARELGLQGLGVIAPGAIADLAVLDARLQVATTWIGGVEVRVRT